MTNNNKFIIEKLDLTNFRCFPELQLDFHEQLTVFVAPNGGGKTAVLDAIAVALRRFVDDMESKISSKGFDPADFRKQLSPMGSMEQVQPLKFAATGVFFGKEARWKREKDVRTKTADMKILKEIAEEILGKNEEWVQKKRPDAPMFPLISYYGTGRLWSHMKMTQGKQAKDPTPNSRKRGYTDCLSPSSHYKFFVDWFRRFSYEAKQEKTDGKLSPHNPRLLLSIVSEAVNTALKPSGWHTLEWDFAEDTARANHDIYGQLPVNSLSDGIRNIIGLVADIAHRAVRLNPHLGANVALETPGIVLIDEVDMHLHPEWQQLVVQSLKDAFPLIQFIVTTHSPQVLTTVRRECIRILKHVEGQFVVEVPAHETYAQESRTTLEDVFDVNSRPPLDINQKLQKYLKLIESGEDDSLEAPALRKEIEDSLGAGDPQLQLADMLIARNAARHKGHSR